MRIHPYIRSIKLVLNSENSNSNDPHVLTDDAEYGEIRWELRDGKLFAEMTAAELSCNMEMEEFVWNEMPAGGDAAIALENETAELVMAVFNLLPQPTPTTEVILFAKLADEEWLVVNDGTVYVWDGTTFSFVNSEDEMSDSIEPRMRIRVESSDLKIVA